MPVRKFRDVSEMEDTLWYERTDPALPRAIAGVWDFAARICPLQSHAVFTSTARSRRPTPTAIAGKRRTSRRFTSAGARSLFCRSQPTD